MLRRRYYKVLVACTGAAVILLGHGLLGHGLAAAEQRLAFAAPAIQSLAPESAITTVKFNCTPTQRRNCDRLCSKGRTDPKGLAEQDDCAARCAKKCGD